MSMFVGSFPWNFAVLAHLSQICEHCGPWSPCLFHTLVNQYWYILDFQNGYNNLIFRMKLQPFVNLWIIVIFNCALNTSGSFVLSQYCKHEWLGLLYWYNVSIICWESTLQGFLLKLNWPMYCVSKQYKGQKSNWLK